MRPVQLSFDEPLLEQLDADDEVRRLGRSAFMRWLVRQYLEQKRAQKIDDQYEQGYASAESPGESLGEAFDGWEDLGVWSDE